MPIKIINMEAMMTIMKLVDMVWKSPGWLARCAPPKLGIHSSPTHAKQTDDDDGGGDD